MSKRKVLLLSSSRLHGFEYLEHARLIIDSFLKKNNVKTILFIPFAQRDYDSHFNMVRKPFINWNYHVESLHNKPDATEAVRNAEAIFIGGGNTFVLLNELYKQNLIEEIREAVLERGVPYIGSSAGTNIATKSIHTTNDMPIVYPPSFAALNLIPFNVNPHYIETNLSTMHRGETRDERLHEFVSYHQSPVVGLREGTGLLIEGDQITLEGSYSCKLFKADGTIENFQPGSDLSFLLKK